MFDVRSFEAKKRVFEFDYQQMNTFEFVRCSIKWCQTHHYQLCDRSTEPFESSFLARIKFCKLKHKCELCCKYFGLYKLKDHVNSVHLKLIMIIVQFILYQKHTLCNRESHTIHSTEYFLDFVVGYSPPPPHPPPPQLRKIIIQLKMRKKLISILFENLPSTTTTSTSTSSTTGKIKTK